MLFPLLLVASLPASAVDAEAYAARFPHTTGDEGQRAVVGRCLSSWATHPFGKVGEQSFRVIRPKVRVMGMGSAEIVDDVATTDPVLVLVEPSVNVMTKTTYTMMNPNGWYCFDTSVTVLGKAVVQVHCHAALAEGRDGGAAVIAANDEGRKNVTTVIGTTRVQWTGCGG
jgi:hypothetical protein